MKTIPLLLLIIALSGSVAYPDETSPPKSETAPGSVRSITLPDIRPELKTGEGRAKVETLCNICHSTDYITGQPAFTRAQWTATVTKMIKVYGAPVSDEDSKTIIEYLVTSYGSGR